MIETCKTSITSLIDVSDTLKPIFPPDWGIMNLYYTNFKEIIYERIQPYIENMDKHVESDHGLLLSCLDFAMACKNVSAHIGIEDQSD